MKPSLLYLAPLRGFTNALYRNLFSRYFDGIDLAIAPFVASVKGTRLSTNHIRDLLPENNPSLPVVPQILSNDPEGFIRLSKRLYDVGYKTVNWNLGCPFPMVAKKKRGSGLLPYPDRIDAFLDEVVPNIPTRLSIKTRIGRNHTDEIFRLIPIFNRYPLGEVIIHPRTGIQMYEGKTALDVFEACLKQLRHPVVYNGDIVSLASFDDLSKRFGQVDRWMIGRSVLTNPFLPAVIKSHRDEIPNKIDIFRKFHDDLFAAYANRLSGPGHILDKMKGYWAYFYQSFENGENLFKTLKKLKAPDVFKTIIDQFLEQATWRQNPHISSE